MEYYPSVKRSELIICSNKNDSQVHNAKTPYAKLHTTWYHMYDFIWAKTDWLADVRCGRGVNTKDTGTEG